MDGRTDAQICALRTLGAVMTAVPTKDLVAIADAMLMDISELIGGNVLCEGLMRFAVSP